MRTLTLAELSFVAGGDYGGGGTFENVPVEAAPSGADDPSHWFDNAAYSTTEYDGQAGQGLGGLTTSYYDANNNFIGEHTSYNDENQTASHSYDGGFFGSLNVPALGDGLVGASVAYGADSGLSIYFDVGVGTPGVAAGYTNDINGYLTGWSGAISGDFNIGTGITPDAQNGALTVGSPGWSATYGWGASQAMYGLAGAIDRVVQY